MSKENEGFYALMHQAYGASSPVPVAEGVISNCNVLACFIFSCKWAELCCSFQKERVLNMPETVVQRRKECSPVQKNISLWRILRCFTPNWETR